MIVPTTVSKLDRMCQALVENPKVQLSATVDGITKFVLSYFGILAMF